MDEMPKDKSTGIKEDKDRTLNHVHSLGSRNRKQDQDKTISHLHMIFCVNLQYSLRFPLFKLSSLFKV